MLATTVAFLCSPQDVATANSLSYMWCIARIDMSKSKSNKQI